MRARKHGGSRMTRTYLAAVLAAAVTAGTAGAPAEAKQVSRFTVKSWSGGAYNDNKTGAFSHCAASVK